MENIKKTQEYEKIIKMIPKTNTKLKELLIAFMFDLLHPQIMLKCAGVPEDIYKQFEFTHPYPDLLAYCITHFTDKTYDGILNKINDLKRDLSGGSYEHKYNKYKTKYLSLKNK